jgi:hypothetical protein
VDGGHRGEAFRQQINKINRTLKEGLEGETLLPFYMVAAVGKYGSKRHGVRIEKINISLKSHSEILTLAIKSRWRSKK